MPTPSSPEVQRGSIAVRHDDHIDVLDHGRLLHKEGGRTEEHVIAVSAKNPDRCDHAHRAAPGHRHGPDCGHALVPHGDHIDYLVEGRLHHPHGDHTDDHGPLVLA